MVKSLLQQALEHNAVPAGSKMDNKVCGQWRRIIRPKGTKCPFGNIHKKNTNCRIRPHDNGFQIRCFSKTCDNKSLYVDTDGGLTAEELAAMVVPKRYTADMF